MSWCTCARWAGTSPDLLHKKLYYKHYSTERKKKRETHTHKLTLSIRLSYDTTNFIWIRTLIIFPWNVWFIVQLYIARFLFHHFVRNPFSKDWAVISWGIRAFTHLRLTLTLILLIATETEFTRKIIRWETHLNYNCYSIFYILSLCSIFRLFHIVCASRAHSF